MADKSVSVKVIGIRELQGAFKQVDEGMVAELKSAFRGIADQIVGDVQGKVPHRSGRAAGSIRARASTKGAGIAFGGTAAPYFPWLDFGGSTGRGHRSGVAGSGAVKRPWMGKPGGDGRFIYPTITEHRSKTTEAVDDAVKRLAAKARFDTKGGL